MFNQYAFNGSSFNSEHTYPMQKVDIEVTTNYNDLEIEVETS